MLNNWHVLVEGERDAVSVASFASRAAGRCCPLAAGTRTSDMTNHLHPVAIAIGEEWARELVRSLRSVDREIIGAWPGTMREARARVCVALRTELERGERGALDEVARVAYLAARRGWQEVSEPDPES